MMMMMMMMMMMKPTSTADIDPLPVTVQEYLRPGVVVHADNSQLLLQAQLPCLRVQTVHLQGKYSVIFRNILKYFEISCLKKVLQLADDK